MEEASMPAFMNDEDRWTAVLNRDRTADGQFVFSVRSTGIYCRPSCAARRANRRNVAFHATAGAAAAAGFRPCLRCRPDAASSQSEAVVKACRLIEAAEAEPSLARLAEAVNLSPFHFQKLFKRETGLTPKAYARAERAQRLGRELAKSASVTEAIYAAGFNSSGVFYADSAKRFGMTPTEIRRGGLGLSIRFALGRSSLGAILVAATEKGICAILIGDDPEILLEDLQCRFPRATLIGADGAFEAWVAEVVGFVEAPKFGLSLPLDIRGTAFQQRVWQALCAIPPGTTASYTEIAEKLGMPKGSRAVAQACAANPIAVAIPCHRVIHRDKSMSGYRWGIARKHELLTREAHGGTTLPAPPAKP